MKKNRHESKQTKWKENRTKTKRRENQSAEENRDGVPHSMFCLLVVPHFARISRLWGRPRPCSHQLVLFRFFSQNTPKPQPVAITDYFHTTFSEESAPQALPTSNVIIVDLPFLSLSEHVRISNQCHQLRYVVLLSIIDNTKQTYEV